MKKILGFLLCFYAVDGLYAIGMQEVLVNSYDETKQALKVFTIYQFDVSTHTAGKLIVTGNIPDINFNVTGISYYSAGGLTAITGIGGTTYIPAGSSLSQSFEIGFSTPTITATLSASTTLYYDIIGTR